MRRRPASSSGGGRRGGCRGHRCAPLAQQAPAPVAPTFTRDIAPIISARCAPCHREGGAAPFTLTSFEDVSSRIGAVARVVETREMPPWLPSQGGETFAGARALSGAERDAILRWSSSARHEASRTPRARLGAGRSQPRRPCRAGGRAVTCWRQRVPISSATSCFVCRSIYALRPRSDDSRRLDARRAPCIARRGRHTHRTPVRCDGRGGRLRRHAHRRRAEPARTLHRMGAGQVVAGLAAGLAWRLEPGVDLVLQVHMMPGGKPETVQPSVAFEFTDEAPRERAVLVRLGSTAIDIPPGARAHVVEDTFDLPSDVRVLAISPHAHYLAREITTVATLPDGRRIPLITIAAWDFRWQDDYRYVTPLVLPALTKITTRVTYDNSTVECRTPAPARAESPGRVQEVARPTRWATSGSRSCLRRPTAPPVSNARSRAESSTRRPAAISCSPRRGRTIRCRASCSRRCTFRRAGSPTR